MLLESGRTVILDGGLATALEAKGLDLSSALWSAKVLQDNPEAIYETHLDYYRAGADVATTASYQASAAGLREHLGMDEAESRKLIQHSVKLAQRARDAVVKEQPSRRLFVAGSVGPYGAYLANGAEYTGEYSIGEQALRDFHRVRLRALVDAGVDVLACETIPSMLEIQVLLDLLRNECPDSRAWLSCTLCDESHISDGTPVADVARLVGDNNQIIALGFNCIPQQLASAALDHLRQQTYKPLIVYSNSGELWDAETREWYGERPQGQALKRLAEDWQSKGARLIGGCCRTTSDDIKIIANTLKDDTQRTCEKET